MNSYAMYRIAETLRVLFFHDTGYTWCSTFYQSRPL